MSRLLCYVLIPGMILLTAMPVAAAPVGHAAVDIVDLGMYVARNNVFLVFAPTEVDPDFARQRDTLSEQRAGVIARDLIVGMLTDDAGGNVGDETATPGAVMVLRAQLHLPDHGFVAVLIGKDGQEKLRQSSPLSAAALFDAIDTTLDTAVPGMVSDSG